MDSPQCRFSRAHPLFPPKPCSLPPLQQGTHGEDRSTCYNGKAQQVGSKVEKAPPWERITSTKDRRDGRCSVASMDALRYNTIQSYFLT